jgi:hypothetical protein
MKKQKIYFFYSTIIVLFTVLLYSCKADIENAVASITGSPDNEVAAAQEWYDKTFQTSLPIGIARAKSSKAKFSTKPDWKHAYSVNYTGYSAVHTPLNTQQRFCFVMPDNKQAYETTGDARYISTFTQMVVIHEKKDDKMYAFLMTLVPDKAYLESTHFAAFSSNYRKWQKGYSGYVLYHTLDGNFNNGWKFENGNVTRRVTQVDENGIDISVGMKNKVSRSGTICSTLTYELWCQLCYYTYTNSESQGVQNVTPSTCSWSYEGNQYLVVCYDSGESSDGGQGSGGGYTGGSDSSSTPTIQDANCSASATTNATNINNVLNAPSYLNTSQDVNRVLPMLQIDAATQSSEYGVTIQKDGSNYWCLDQSDNNSGIYIVSNSISTNVNYAYNINSYIACHTHGQTVVASPSPCDAGFLGRAYKGGATNIYANVVFDYGGSQYAVYVSDRTAFTAFCNNTANAGFFTLSADNNFLAGSAWGISYNTVYNTLLSKGYSQTDANSFALTYVLDQYNTGMKVAERDNSGSNFREQSTGTTNTGAYQPQRCPSNN